MKHKLTALFLAALLCLGLAACGGASRPREELLEDVQDTYSAITDLYASMTNLKTSCDVAGLTLDSPILALMDTIDRDVEAYRRSAAETGSFEELKDKKLEKTLEDMEVTAQNLETVIPNLQLQLEDAVGPIYSAHNAVATRMLEISSLMNRIEVYFRAESEAERPVSDGLITEYWQLKGDYSTAVALLDEAAYSDGSAESTAALAKLAAYKTRAEDLFFRMQQWNLGG